MLDSKFFRSFLFVIFYGALFYVLQYFFAATHFFETFPNQKGIMNGDCYFYDTIRQYGYSKDPNANGFFILFPLIWKISCLNIWGIAALNIVFFAFGFAILMKTLDTEDKLFWLLLLTMPAVIHAFIPLTESLFFLLGSLVIYAIKENKKGLLYVLLFLIALLRATTLFVIPALFMAEVLALPLKDWRKSIWSFCKLTIPSVLGLALFIYWQYFKTGVWFIYFKTQAEHWDKKFSIPGFPLKNIEGGDWRYHWLSALALLIGITSICFVIQKSILWLKNNSFHNKNAIFSSVFLGMIFIFILFFNPKYGGNYTFVMGANRYTIITPFCFYMLHYWYKQVFSYKTITIYIVLSNAFFALFNALFDKEHYFLIGLIPTLIISAFMFYSNSSRQKHWLICVIIAFNFLTQMLFFQQYMQNIFLD